MHVYIYIYIVYDSSNSDPYMHAYILSVFESYILPQVRNYLGHWKSCTYGAHLNCNLDANVWPNFHPCGTTFVNSIVCPSVSVTLNESICPVR